MKKRGVGVACMYYGIGKTGHPGPAAATVDIRDDGNVIVMTGLADMGQGANTGLGQITADTLGVPMSAVAVVTGDTMATPDAGVTSASRSTYVIGNAVHRAAQAAMEPILEEVASRLEVSTTDLVAENGLISVAGSPDHFVPLREAITACRQQGTQTIATVSFNPEFEHLNDKTGQGSPYPTYAFATQMAEVEVDTETGEIQVLRVVAAHDVGRAINPTSIEGQIEGGVAQGLGYALMEDVQFAEGKVMTPTLSTYLLPTSLDMCEVESILIEDAEPSGPFGAKGVGEPALIPSMPAITGAIYDAVGVLITDLPATPEKILDGIAVLAESDNGEVDSQ